MQFDCRVDVGALRRRRPTCGGSRPRGRPRADLPVPDHGARPAVGADAAPARGHGQLQGPARSTPIDWPHGAGRPGRQAGGGHRHRRHRHPGDRRDRRQGRRADGVPAPAELVPRRCNNGPISDRGDGRHPRPLRRDLRHLRPHARRLRPRARPARLLRGLAARSGCKLWEQLYGEPGFGIWLANFREIFMDEEANAEFSEYIADQIRQRVKDPVDGREADPARTTASACSGCRWRPTTSRPTTGPTCTWSTSARRRSSASPETGIRTTERDYEFDIIVYATGFDAITGAFDRIDIRGRGRPEAAGQVGGRPVDLPRHAWSHGFPNMLMLAGPQSGSASTNFPRGIETGVDWVHRPAAAHPGARLHPLRADARGRGALDRPRDARCTRPC